MKNNKIWLNIGFVALLGIFISAPALAVEQVSYRTRYQFERDTGKTWYDATQEERDDWLIKREIREARTERQEIREEQQERREEMRKERELLKKKQAIEKRARMKEMREMRKKRDLERKRARLDRDMNKMKQNLKRR